MPFRTLLNPAAATSDSRFKPYGLALEAATVPVGLRTHVMADGYATNVTTQTYRFFMPLSDPAVTAVLPKFGNWISPGNWATNGEIDPGWALTIAAAVEMSDGTVVPFTWNGGSHSFIFPANSSCVATPDSPLAIGAQTVITTSNSETVSGCWMRTYVSVTAPRTDICGITSGSPTVTDAAIGAGDVGKAVTGTGIFGFNYVGTVTPGVSFLLSSSPTSQANINATATNASASLLIGPVVPQGIGALVAADSCTTTSGADLTLAGSGSVSGGSGTSRYGPLVVLGRSNAHKPVVALLSDSILNGFSESAGSSYWGPVARACTALGYPMVKFSKSATTTLDWVTVGNARYKMPFLDGCTHALVELGTNDGQLGSSGGVTTLQSRITTIGALLAGMGIKAYLCTVPPKTSSTDSWATTVSQTPNGGSLPAHLASFNTWVRGVPAPWVGCFDLAASCESSITPDSGLWAAGATIDGLHPSSATMLGEISTTLQTSMAGWTI